MLLHYSLENNGGILNAVLYVLHKELHGGAHE